LGLPQGEELHPLRGKYLVAFHAKLYVRFESWMPFLISRKKNLSNVPSSKNKHFCQQLTDWLHVTEWHFTTLLAISIDSINELPDDADHFINCLLLSYPAKPSHQQLNDYINNSTIVKNWFQGNLAKPSIKSFNLDVFESVQVIDSNFPQFDSLLELAYWLGLSLTQLEWLADLKRFGNYEPKQYKHYHYSLVNKRRGGVRIIESPKTLLKRSQKQIHSRLLTKASVHRAAHGFRHTRSCFTNAENHTNKQYLFTFDLANYFHSIGWYRIYKVFRGLGYTHEIAKYLSGLCTHRFTGHKSLLMELDDCQRKMIRKRHLAQGAPTSPALSNLVMYKLDKRLDGLAESLELTYSRYADDLAFSGNKHRDWRFLEPLVGSICLEEGFELNYRKSRIVGSHQRQKITGIIVNQGVNIDRRYYDRLKAILTNCIRYGVGEQNIDRHDDLQSHLFGSIMFVNSLNKNRGQKLIHLYQQIDFV